MKKYIVLYGILAAALLLLPAAGGAFEQAGPRAGEFPFVNDRGSVSIGTMHVYLNSQLRLNRANALPGTLLDGLCQILL